MSILDQVTPGCRCLTTDQMLTVLQAESWLAFNQSELDVLERLILDEAAEVFGEPPCLGA